MLRYIPCDKQNQRVIDIREKIIYCRCRKMKMMPKNIKNLTVLVKFVDFDQGYNALYHWKTLLNFLSMHLKLPFCQKLIWRKVESMEKNELNNITEDKALYLKGPIPSISVVHFTS